LTILIDECLPEDLKTWLPELDMQTVQDMGWAGVKNGELLRRAEEQFDVFVTADKNIQFQQNLRGLRIMILVLPSNRLTILRAMIAEIRAGIAALEASDARQYTELPLPEGFH
jgi:predicted nuclease of predicted toxin-antitoxin system